APGVPTDESVAAEGGNRTASAPDADANVTPEPAFCSVFCSACRSSNSLLNDGPQPVSAPLHAAISEMSRMELQRLMVGKAPPTRRQATPFSNSPPTPQKATPH